MNEGVLLDTCAAIWVMSNARIADAARAAIERAAQADQLCVSPFVAWEMAMLASRGRAPISTSPTDWYEALLKVPGVREVEIYARLLIRSHQLPGAPPRDPMDRLMIASAIEHGLALTTRDQAILDYGEAGHARVLAC